MKPEIQELLGELSQTARVLAGRGDITVVEGDERGWSFNERSGVISMDTKRLRTESANFNRGLLMHEGAHAAITRLHWFMRGNYFLRPEVFSVINAFEDCRIEAWLLERFPGCRGWVEEYNDKLIGETVGGRGAPAPGRPLFTVLPWLIVSSWWHGREAVAATLSPEWKHLQDEVWPAVEAVRQAFPRGQLPPAEIRQRYVTSGLSLTFLAEDTQNAPDVWEQEVRLCQAEMWDVFEKIILPVVRRLVPESAPMRNPERFRAWLHAWLSEHHAGPRPGPSPRSGRLRGRQLGAWLRSKSGGGPTDRSEVVSRDDLPEYERLAQGQARAIERVSEELLRCLQPAVQRRWSGPHSSGPQLCLRSVVRAEGDPQRRGLVWRRISGGEKLPDPVFVLLIDRSGSMQGERIKATTAATVLLAETCARCGLGLSVFAFGDECEQVADFRDALDESARARIGGLPTSAEGGTELAEALQTVRPHVTEAPFAQKYFVILSDGGVSDEAEVRNELLRLKGEGVQVLGLGLGDETKKLRQLIPDAQIELTPSQLPGAFLRLLRRAVPRPGAR
jgi:uncharacterized protein YegL